MDSNSEPLDVDNPTEIQESLLNKLKIDQYRAGSGEFCLIVSMHDGKVLYASPTLTDVLGFPADMWIGRSLIDFIHHKDRVAFANHITLRKYGYVRQCKEIWDVWNMYINSRCCWTNELKLHTGR